MHCIIFNMKRYRNEWKYILPEYDLMHLEDRVSHLLLPDPHSPEGRYVIHSLYFDDYLDSCAQDNEAGTKKRCKYRIRYYGKDLHSLHLERKEKTGNLCHKESVPLSIETYELICSGNVSSLLMKLDELYLSDPQKLMLKQFCAKILLRHFTPKIIVDYNRTAFVDEITDVRITFDRNICVSDRTECFLSKDYPTTPILNGQESILEVKFDYILPSFLKYAACLPQMIPCSFSKYYMGRMRLSANR